MKPISSAAIALVFLFFFLPWVTVSCGGEEIVTLSGYDLSVGKDISAYGDKTDADPLVFLIPIAALMAIGTLFIANKNAAGGGQVVAAVVGLGIMGIKWRLMFENDDPYVEIVTRYGAWGSLAGLLLLLAGGMLTLMVKESRPLVHTPPKPIPPSRPPQPQPPSPSPRPQQQPPPVAAPPPYQPPPVQQPAAPAQCPQCHTVLRLGARFCPKCGHKM